MRVRFGQENGAEPVRDVEPRIERRRDIEQRIQEVERDGRFLRQRRRRLERIVEPLLGVLRSAAVVLNRSYPVQVRRQRALGEDDTARGALRQIERFLVAGRERIASVTQRLQPPARANNPTTTASPEKTDERDGRVI
jgi:hypothetical protein